MDAFSRLVLAVIAILLFVLVLGQLGILPVAPQTAGSALAPDAGAEAGSARDGARFSLTPVRISPKASFLLRIDQQTGRTWKVKFPVTSSGWQEVLEGEEVREHRAASEAERKAKAEAADRVENQ